MPADTLVARDEGGYEKPPADGYSAVACDVIDLGYHWNRTFGKVEHKIAIVFQLDALNSTGKRYEISHRLTFTFGEKSNLRKFLAQWRGRSYSDEEARTGAPLHKLEGQPAYITIEHKTVGDKTYANIVGITKLPRGLTAIQPDGYTRSPNWKKQSASDADAQKFAATIPGVPLIGTSTTHTVPQAGSQSAALARNDADDYEDDFSPHDQDDLDSSLPF